MKKRHFDILLVLVFALLICTPLVGSIFSWDSRQKLSEKRELAKCPIPGKDSLDEVPEKFENFYNDHFGFRNMLVRSHNMIKYKTFKSSSGKVMTGRDGWLFLTKSGIIPDRLGMTPYTLDQLNIWKDRLQQKQDLLAAMNMKYLLVIAPNKTSIYPEMLPANIAGNLGRTRMDQLVDHLKEKSTVNLIDLRPSLADVKQKHLLYYSNDSHWNCRGAFVAYKAIIAGVNKWFPEIKMLDDSELKSKETTHEGDLSAMLGLEDALEIQTEELEPINNSNVTVSRLELPWHHSWHEEVSSITHTVSENPDGRRRALIFHDSFVLAGNMKQFISHSFQRASFVNDKMTNETLELMAKQESPDVVIEELVERTLGEMP